MMRQIFDHSEIGNTPGPPELIPIMNLQSFGGPQNLMFGGQRPLAEPKFAQTNDDILSI